MSLALRKLRLLALLPAIVAGAAKGAETYADRDIEGWPVRVNEAFLRDRPELAAKTLDLLRVQLSQIVRRLPSDAVGKLRTITIWVEEAEPHHPCMAYHPDAGWLRDHGMSEEKARCVEIANAKNFLSWTIDQPWMVLHELAHGYHHQKLDGGFENKDVRRAFERAKAAGSYQSVLRINGRDEKAYALTDPMEFFAEATEAFFGTNDFYPFVRAELKAYDPETFAVLEKLWKMGG